MTKEQERAIRRIKNRADAWAVKEVTDALEQLQCKDAISREAAIKVIRQKTSRYTLAKENCGIGQVEWSDYLIKESDAIDGLNELPPVTQKSGYWITKEAYSEDKAMGITEQIVCSNCDMQNSYFSEWDECKNPIAKTFIRSKFCPNCGARMVKPQESDIEKRKPCINYEDGCEEWAGCPCVHYKAESEE